MSLFFELEEKAARKTAVVNGQIPRRARVAPLRKKELNLLIQLARKNHNLRFLAAVERGVFADGFMAAIQEGPLRKPKPKQTTWESQKDHFMIGGSKQVAIGTRKSIAAISGGLPTLGKRR